MQWTGDVGDYGMTGKAQWVRIWRAQGWSIEELAQYFGVPSSVIIQVLECRQYRRPRFSRALPAAEKERRRVARAREREARARQREKAKPKARARRWLLDDWRFKDDIGSDGTVELLAPLAAAELVHQASAAEISATMLEPPALEPWAGPTSPHASAGKARKITAAILATAVKLHQDGRSWPAIARELGCHRMALYHARKRSSGNL